MRRKDFARNIFTTRDLQENKKGRAIWFEDPQFSFFSDTKTAVSSKT